MPDLLLELFSEEIPARMQARAAEDLRKLVTDRLVEAGLVYEGARAFVTPRRLALAVHGVPARQADRREEKKGPRVGAPENAIAGFVKAAGLKSIKDAKVQPDKKGDFYVAVIEQPGRAAIEVIKDVVMATLVTFPWPKSMRWGKRSETPGSITWVRPLHSILATFGPETEEPDVIQFEIDGVKSGNETRGHRFMAPAPFKVRRLADYQEKLEKAKVVLDPARRRDIILTEAKQLAFAQGLELIEDEGLLAEVAGLVEWPVVLMGAFDADFLRIPEEVIRATVRTNLKCFVLRDAAHAKLTNKFILVANIEAADGGKAIVAGNERVIRARLADAKFFYEADLKTLLEDRLPKFKDIVFHEKLGSQWERIERIERLAAELAPLVGADVEKAERAARLAKADLLTEIVGEFPELQGTMGKYYAQAQGEDEAVAHACEDHYRPRGPNDLVPSDRVSVAVALADKIDTLVGFWAIDEMPTGSGDPHALRRAALGLIRIVLDNEIDHPLSNVFGRAVETYLKQHNGYVRRKINSLIAGKKQPKITKKPRTRAIKKAAPRMTLREIVRRAVRAYNASDLQDFVKDRLKVQLRQRGVRHDFVEAAFANNTPSNLFLNVRRLDALTKFLETDDGKNLLVGYRRAANILRDEEGKDDRLYSGSPDQRRLQDPIESHLWKTIRSTVVDARYHVKRKDFESAMETLSALRSAVDSFFDKVTVNVEDKKLRENRLKLLNEIRAATLTVADFSKIEG